MLNHLETLSQHVGMTAADILMRMKASKLMELMGRYGIQCKSCLDKADYLSELIHRLALPLRFSSTGNKLEVLERPFIHNAYAKQSQESKAEVSAAPGWHNPSQHAQHSMEWHRAGQDSTAV